MHSAFTGVTGRRTRCVCLYSLRNFFLHDRKRAGEMGASEKKVKDVCIFLWIGFDADLCLVMRMKI